jgi:hypothetical protein
MVDAMDEVQVVKLGKSEIGELARSRTRVNELKTRFRSSFSRKYLVATRLNSDRNSNSMDRKWWLFSRKRRRAVER